MSRSLITNGRRFVGQVMDNEGFIWRWRVECVLSVLGSDFTELEFYS